MSNQLRPISTSFKLSVASSGGAGLSVSDITIENMRDATVCEVGDYIDYTGLVVKLSFMKALIKNIPDNCRIPDFDKYGITLSPHQTS